MKIHSIVACCNNRGIGNNGKLPWRLKKEMSYFRALTMGSPPVGKRNAVLMGRKTWQSLPRPLKGRYNFVLSRTLTEKQEGMDGIVHSVEEFLNLMNSDDWSSKVHEVINIGGVAVYKAVFGSAFCGRIYLTRVKADYECDTFLPDFGSGFSLLRGYPEDVAKSLPSGVQVEVDGVEWFVEVYEKT